MFFKEFQLFSKIRKNNRLKFVELLNNDRHDAFLN